jgi:hypothetical protein
MSISFGEKNSQGFIIPVMDDGTLLILGALLLKVKVLFENRRKAITL